MKYSLRLSSIFFVLVFFVLVFFVLVFFASLQAFGIERNALATIIRVIDGDTLKVSYQRTEETIRLIGIDAPESRVNKKAMKDVQRSGEDLETIVAMGKEAINFVKALVKPGDMVKIEFDINKRDKYGRFLGYVYLSEGKMLNEEIVKAGYANIMTVPPNVRYQERFLRAYREARENKRGLWK